MNRMKIAVDYVKMIAEDNRRGYSQPRRDWNSEDDCSTGAIDAMREAGYILPGATYTNNVLEPMLAEGFQDVTSQVNMRTGEGLEAGDVLLRLTTPRRGGHMAIMISKTQLVQFQQDYDGVPGDSSGREIRIQDYYDSPFTYALREPTDLPTIESPVPQIEMHREQGGIGTIVNVRQWCHRREKPTTASKSVGQAYLGDKVAVNGKRIVNGDLWFHDTIGNWIHSDYVRIEAYQIPWM